MQTFKFDRPSTQLFSAQQNRLVYDQESLLPFIQRTFSEENLLRQINLKSEAFSPEDRDVLVNVLRRQHQRSTVSAQTLANIEKLQSENAFTITTGHQLSLFTGPLYFVVKILQVIKLVNYLNERNPDSQFVPVYWMASEDHDFEEIRSMELFGKKVRWESSQSGPVGRFALDEGFNQAISEIKAFFKEEHKEVLELIDSYKGKNLADASRNLVQQLFGSYGLVVVDGDDVELKRRFSAIMTKELSEEFSFAAVSLTNHELKKEGLIEQIHAREINLFYIENGLRSRIIKDNQNYSIPGKGEFTREELVQILKESPESFSPNVVLRPLYQEHVLPNLAYIGGGGEISYWLQLKRVFEAARVIYPLIQVRNSVLWVDSNTTAKIQKLDMSLENLFKSADLLKREYVEFNERGSLDFDELDEQTNALAELIDKLVGAVDPGLQKYSSAEITRLHNQIDSIKSKLIKTSKSKHETAMNSIDQVKEKLFPGGGLQERTVNFFQFCADGEVQRKLEQLYSALDPFEKDLVLIRDF